MIGEIYLAGSDDEAVTHLDRGPFVDGVTDAVSIGELTSLELDALQSVLTDSPFRDVLESGEGGLLRLRTESGPWVSRVRPRLTGALARVDGARVEQTARRWAERDEVENIPVETLVAVLGPLSDLARTAGDRGAHLYLWNSL